MPGIDMNMLLRRSKSGLIIRTLAYPYMSVKKALAYKSYLNSADALKIKQLKDRYKGERCFVVGNGASLRTDDLEKLKGELTFACNRIYNVFESTSWRPTFYLAEDTDGFKEMIPHIKGQGIENIVLNNKAKSEGPDKENIYWAQWGNGRYVINRYNDRSIHVSEDVSKYFCVGYTVTFSAIQLAIYMGVGEIYLLGVDFDYSVITNKWGKMISVSGVQTYFDGKERPGSYLNYYSTMRAYSAAKEYCDAHGIKTANATRGGKLEVFERVDFDSLFEYK